MKSVLVGVLKSEQDLKILLREKWYRIPLSFLPKREFTHIAFYEPALPKRRLAAKRVASRGGPRTDVGRGGKCIRYYARVAKREVKKRVELLPDERAHRRAHEPYLKCSFRAIKELAEPIRNIIPRRVSFGFTSLKTLRSAKDILQLYGVPPTEQLVERRLKQLGIPFTSQYHVACPSPPLVRRGAGSARQGGGVRRYRLDLAIFCKKGKLAIECDNQKAHGVKPQREKDLQKDAALRRLGWRVIRLAEADIVERLGDCVSRISAAARAQGGVRIY